MAGDTEEEGSEGAAGLLLFGISKYTSSKQFCEVIEDESFPRTQAGLLLGTHYVWTLVAAYARQN